MNVNKIHLVSAMMGLGHMRAAYALKDITNEGILVDGSNEVCSLNEQGVWDRIRKMYYVMSRTEGIPIIGHKIFKFISAMQNVPPFYPKRDLSAPNNAIKWMTKLIKNSSLGSGICAKIKNSSLPVVSTFYGSSIAIDRLSKETKDNYLVICDTDFNRVWVSENVKDSRIKYIAPCSQVVRRLIAYGVPKERIFLTGFPLPKENIGSEAHLEILKEDLFKRLLRLDPTDKFFNLYGDSVYRTISDECNAFYDVERKEDYFTLTFAVGGAGAQAEMAKKILTSLRSKIVDGKIKINLSAGIREDVAIKFNEYLKELNLDTNENVKIIYDKKIYKFFDLFNKALRNTDVLYTKPSELTFFAGLGIPILIAPPVGSHECINESWLYGKGAGITQIGNLKNIDEWLFDLQESGVLARAAWNGFINIRKLGTYCIEELISTGKVAVRNKPIER